MIANDRSRPGLLESVRVAARDDWAPSGSTEVVQRGDGGQLTRQCHDRSDVIDGCVAGLQLSGEK